MSSIIFMGTPDFSVPTLQALAAAGHDIVAVYSQPPRPGGRRGLDIQKSPVHLAAEALGIESLLAGLRASEPDDDALLARACEIFDWLLKSYEDKTT